MTKNEWFYALTANEEAMCAKIGFERQLPYLGQPEKNRNYSEGDVWESIQHMICVGSELAFARMMGLTDFVPHVNKWKTELDIPGFGEVRYAFPRSFPEYDNDIRGLRMTQIDDLDLRYVLLVNGLGRKTRREAPDWKGSPYLAVGWAYGHECIKDTYKFNAKTWYMPRGDLRPMEELSLT
jgi:hypothetical protein